MGTWQMNHKKTQSWTHRCIYNFLPWIQKHWAHSSKFHFRLVRDDSVCSCNKMADSILLIQKEQRKRGYDSLLPSCPVSQCSHHLPQQSHTTLKLKLTRTHCQQQRGCEGVWWIQAGLSPRCILWVFCTLLSWAWAAGCVKAHHALCLFEINDWCCNQWPLEAQC